MSRPDGLRFRISPSARGGAWSTFGADRQVVAQGTAPSRNAAAACVIRALAQTAVIAEADLSSSRAA